jgi:glycolate oxidase subunit GlcD
MSATPVADDVLDDLLAAGGEAGFVVGERLEPYTRDASFMSGPIAAALLPASTDEVSRIVSICNSARVPVVARGAGTSLVGGPVALAGGIVLSLERIDDIEIDAASACAVVGAGAINGRVQEAAAAAGLWYPPDPGSMDMSTIGGNVATNAGGMCCLKYGVTADYVLGMKVVLPDGSVLDLGGRTRKRSSGYRLAQLFVGAEGTLGVMTEICLKLIPRPTSRSVALVAFGDNVQAGAAVARLLAAGHLPCALELMDAGVLELLADKLPDGLRPDMASVLIIEQDGNDGAVVDDELQAMVAILDGTETLIAVDAHQRERLWAARRHIGTAVMEHPANSLTEDVAVPIARIPDMLARIEEIKRESGLRIPVVGHAGDGNLHPFIRFDDDERAKVGPAAAAIFRAAVEFGGTISGEHGLGILKRDHASIEHSERALELMRGLKELFDPNGILNPHKVFPEQPADDAFLDALPGWGTTGAPARSTRSGPARRAGRSSGPSGTRGTRRPGPPR